MKKHAKSEAVNNTKPAMFPGVGKKDLFLGQDYLKEAKEKLKNLLEGIELKLPPNLH